MTVARGDLPSQYSFYVFWSKSEEPTDEERESGIYLLERAEGRYLEHLFESLYHDARITILTSDDAIIPPSNLSPLLEAVVSAILDVEAKPEAWPVYLGHKAEPYQKALGAAVFRTASRASLLEFLEGTERIIRQAIDAGGYVSFGGGM